MDTLKQVLMRRDGFTAEEADEQIRDAKEELKNRLEAGELPFDICEELFGLEPDYIFDLVDGF